jgi:rubrerythrin
MQTVEERIESLELALNNEKKEREFYLKNAERTTHPLGKQLFKTIADDEMEHYDRILVLHKKLKEAGKWPETLPLTVKGTPIKSVLNKVVEAVTSEKADADEIQAVEIAIAFERKGEAFYKRLYEDSKDVHEKEFYRTLMTIEREHRLSLEDTQFYFKDPDGWFRANEGSRLDGA